MKDSAIMDKIQKQIRITGRVQGVGFRYFTRQNAHELGISGWVKNLRNGDVEALLEGTVSDVNEMVSRLKTGPVAARVHNVQEVERSDSSGEQVDGFTVKR
ncbi:acylphosphatase [soil metagenome]